MPGTKLVGFLGINKDEVEDGLKLIPYFDGVVNCDEEHRSK